MSALAMQAPLWRRLLHVLTCRITSIAYDPRTGLVRCNTCGFRYWAPTDACRVEDHA